MGYVFGVGGYGWGVCFVVIAPLQLFFRVRDGGLEPISTCE